MLSIRAFRIFNLRDDKFNYEFWVIEVKEFLILCLIGCIVLINMDYVCKIGEGVNE